MHSIIFTKYIFISCKRNMTASKLSNIGVRMWFCVPGIISLYSPERVSCSSNEHSALSCILQLPVSPLCSPTRKREMKKEKGEGGGGRATIRRKGSSLASEMSVNASRTLSASFLPSFLLSSFPL